MAKVSSNDLSTLASDVLKNKNSSEIAKSLAGSVLAQAKTGKVSSEDLSRLASKVLKSEKYSETTKSLAGSVLAQTESE